MRETPPAKVGGEKRDGQGRLLQLQTHLRKRAEEAFHDVAERYRELFENANDIVFTVDLTGRFTSVNQAGIRLTGYTKDEVLKMNFTQVVAPEYVTLARKMLAHHFAGEDPTILEIEIVAKDGRRVPLEASTQLLVRNGRRVGVQGIGRNITKRKLAEEESHRRAILMGRLIGLTETLNQPLTEPEVVEAIGRGALRLGEAGRGVLLIRQTDGTVACRWSQGVSSAYIAQVLAHLRDLPAGHLMTEVVDQLVELPGGSVVRGTKPFLLSDVQAQESELVSRLAGAEGYRAIGIWPLTSEGRTVGLMKCYYDAPRTWSNPELDVLHVFFRQAAVALENARLYEARAQRAAELEALLALSKTLRAAHGPDEIYPLLVEQARRLLHAAYGALALLDEARETFTGVHDTRELLKGHGTPIPVHGSLLGRVVLTGAPLRVDDAGLPHTDPDRDAGPVVVVPVRSEEEVTGVLAVGHPRGRESRLFTDADVSFLQGIAEIGGTAIQRARLDLDLQQAYVQMVLALAHATAPRHASTELHSFRLVTLAEEIARALGAGPEEIEDIRWGTRLHDIGKVGVPDGILNKPGPLTDRERAVMRRHPIIGEEILARVQRMRGVAKLVRHHQEEWDGTGYPDGLGGEAIPLGARILAVVAAYGAIIEPRPDKPAQTHEDAVAEIRRCAGTRFDPAVVEVFCQTIERVRAVEEAVD